MPLQVLERSARLRIPDFRRVVPTPRDDQPAVRAVRHGGHWERVPKESHQAAASLLFEVRPLPAALFHRHLVQLLGSQENVAFVEGRFSQDHVCDAKAVLEFLGSLGLLLASVISFNQPPSFFDQGSIGHNQSPSCPANAGQQCDQQKTRRDHRAAMLSHKLPQAVAPARRRGQHWLIGEVPENVGREAVGGLVTPLAILFERFHHHPVEITAHRIA